MTDDRRFLSHACLEPKVERDQDGLHLIIPYRNKTSLGLVFSPTARLDSQQPLQFRQFTFFDRGGKNRERERSTASMLLLRVRENMYNSSSSAVGSRLYIGVRHTASIDDA